MAHRVRFVIFANDNPLLSIAVGKDTVKNEYPCVNVIGRNNPSFI